MAIFLLMLMICKKRGIQPELASLKDNVCSIGFCKREQKWYGWGPEALCGFGIGSKTVRGDYGYIPFDANELAEGYRKWHDIVKVIDDATIMIYLREFESIRENSDGSRTFICCREQEQYRLKTGKGEWTAWTLEAAKGMAKDFARGVS